MEVFAHRGYTRGVRENTLEAFLEARRLGADGVELDVRPSKDGGLVVHHDPVIDGLGPIADLGVQDLPEEVPLLADALEACVGMRVNIEIKNAPGEPGFDPEEAIALAVAQLILEFEVLDSTIVSSFSSSTIDAVQRADHRIPLGWLLGVSARPLERLDQAIAAGYQAIHPFVTSVDAELIERAHGAGLAVNVWTVNAPEDLARMVELGVDAVVTDQLESALAVVNPT
jgi:glycerophosphoryl diester phosphodiesterase